MMRDVRWLVILIKLVGVYMVGMCYVVVVVF